MGRKQNKTCSKNYLTYHSISFMIDRQAPWILMEVKLFKEISILTATLATKGILLSHVMTKPAFAICEQQRRRSRRSACASVQSDQLPG